MKLTDKRFWITWGVLLVIMVGCCISEGWSEDMALLGGAYVLSLLSTWLCHRIRLGVAYGNSFIVMRIAEHNPEGRDGGIAAKAFCISARLFITSDTVPLSV